MDTYKQILVSGRVQGVFFRDSTRQQATELKLAGGVRNLSDGRVEVLVAGDETAVQSLIKWLKIGPKLAKVSTIEVVDLTSDSVPVKQSGKFEIWYNQI
jgi:acylphosphatase